MDRPNKIQYKYMLEVLNHVKHKLNYGFKIISSKSVHWELKCYSGSDFSGEVVNRKSISGYVIYLNNKIISWRSKQKPTATLSSTKEEYV